MRTSLFQLGGDIGEQPHILALDDRGDQVVLVREPPVDGGAADPGPACDVVEGNPPKAVAFELDDGGVEDGCQGGISPWHSP